MIKIVLKYLSISGYSKLNNEYENLIYSHPNYPSLYAITDTFDSLSIDNITARVDKSHLNELPTIFMAYITSTDGIQLALVEKSNDKIIVETEKGVKTNYAAKDFISIWDEIIVAIEPNAEEKVVRKNKATYFLQVLAVLSIYGIFVFRNGFNLHESFFFFTSIIGLAVGFFIVQEKLGVPGEIASKICNGLKTACDSVINSKNSEINSWLSFSDVPILFFGINSVALFLDVATIKYIGITCILSFPFLGYSIWLQKTKLKKWCTLCLISATIIFLQSIVFLLTDNFLINFSDSFYYFFSLAFISAIWFFIKPIVEKKIKSEKQVAELFRFKRNFALFSSLLKDIESIQGFDMMSGIDLGSKDSNLQLTLILSPSCGHCHKAYQDANSLLHKFPDKINLRVLFNVNPENKENPYQLVVQNLLAISYYRKAETVEALSDWHIKNLSLEVWLKKWGRNEITFKVKRQIQLQYDWCLENNFNYTPVKIVNNKLFPQEYEISELRYFLNDFNQLTTKENNTIAEAI